MIPDLRAPFFRQNWCRVLNATGAVIPPHSVVLRNGTVSISDGEPVFSVIQPNSSSTQFNWEGYLVTGPQAIGASSSSEGWATELWTPGFVRYAGSTPTAGTVYGPKHGQLTLQQNYYGYVILGGATTSGGNNVCVAKWIGIASIKGKIDDTNVSALATCTVSVWDGARSGDTTMNVTAVNPTSNLTSVNGKRCQVTVPGGTPELIFVEC